jgi:hypothetical protein
VLDNIDVLRQLGPGASPRGGVQLFRPAPAVRGVDPGVMIDYYLARAPRKLTLEILDPSGKVIRTFEGAVEKDKKDEEEAAAGEDDEDEDKAPPKPGMKAGLNRYTWDMHYPGYTEFKGMVLWAGANRGPLALPGTYRARLTVDGRATAQPFEIRMDPRVQGVTPADLQRRFDLALQIRNKVSEANDSVLLIRGIRKQISDDLAKTTDATVRASGQQLDQHLAAIEGEIYQVQNRSRQDPLNYPIKLNNKMAALGGVVEGAEAAPTDQSFKFFAMLSQQLDRQLGALQQVLGQELPAFNAELKRAGLPPVERRPEPAVEQGTALKDDLMAGTEEDEE